MLYEITKLMLNRRYTVHIWYNDVISTRDILEGRASEATRVTIIDHVRGRFIAEYIPGEPVYCINGTTANELNDIDKIADSLRYEYGISGPIWERYINY